MRGQGFGQSELTSLLDFVERHLLISARDWDIIATIHLMLRERMTRITTVMTMTEVQ
jgi:hypothetical protein